MPTSATGARRASEQGFSLVEVMVAVAIMGLLTGAVLLTAPEREARLSDEAEQLAARLVHAREEALATSRPVEMTVDARGYAFRVQRRGAWTDLDEPPFAPARWSEGVSVALEGDEAGVRFDSTGAAEPARLRVSGRRGSVVVEVDAQGEVRVDDGRG